MNSRKALILIALALACLLMVPPNVQATSYSWYGTYNSAWNYLISGSSNWGSSTYPGNGTSYTDQAKIGDLFFNNLPITLNGKTILLGGATTVLTITTYGNYYTNALNLNNLGILGLKGNVSNNASFYGHKSIITINNNGQLRNDGSAGTHYSISGVGSITLAGGSLSSLSGGVWDIQQNVTGYGYLSAPTTLNSTSTITANNSTPIYVSGNLDNQGGTLTATGSGSFSNSATLSGYGTISAPVTNSGTVTASGSGQTLTVTGVVSGSGNVNVGANASDTVTMAVASNLAANNFTLNQSASLNQTAGTITLSGNFNNYAISESQWLPAGGINLSMTGSTFEVAGYDYGAVNTGFSSNFNLASLYLPASADLLLADLVNNGNQGGEHTLEALYITSLTGALGAQLDLNGLWCYVMKDGSPYALPNGYYGNVLVTDSPVPIPGSVLLLGTGLLGLGLVRWRRRKS